MRAAINPAVEFRSRSGWEATDMGIFLWRTNWVSLFLFTGIPAGILFVFCHIILRSDFTWAAQISVFIMWWFKPLLDRFCLQVVSVRFFEPQASFRRLFRGLGKTLSWGLIGDIFWRRFSPYRSARMPLLVLERLETKDYQRRKFILIRNGLGFGLALTVICIGMDMILRMGELVFLYGILNMIKGNTGGFIEFINEESTLVLILFFFNLLLIETLYVCMGFGLYINARVETEGWDIELLFRKCVENVKQRSTNPTAVLIVFFLLAAGKPEVFGSPIQARENFELLQPAPVSIESKENLDRIFESPVFGQEVPSQHIRFKQPNDPNRPITRWNLFSFPELRNTLGWFLRLVVIAALLIILFRAMLYIWRNKNRLSSIDNGRSFIQEEAAAAESRRLLKWAEDLYRQGRIREAWALCFRAFLAAFTRLWHVSFPAETTEYEALALIQSKIKPGNNSLQKTYSDFSVFIRQWTNLAYGNIMPTKGNFEEALSFCRHLLDGDAIGHIPPVTMELE